MTDSNNQPPKRRRARQGDGSFRADNPATPHNEAWEAVDLAGSVSTKEVKHTIKQKVGGTSEATPGKYSKKKKIRPTFGSVTTVYN